MNPYLKQARQPILEYLGLTETVTLCTKIRCGNVSLPHIVAAMRPRAMIQGGHTHIHNAAKHDKAMREIRRLYTEARGTIRGSFEGPVVFSMVTHRAVPKSWPKRRIGEQDIAKPDTSNILKLVEDALNGVAYKDDSQIVASIPLKAPRRGDWDWYEIEITYCEVTDAPRLSL